MATNYYIASNQKLTATLSISGTGYIQPCISSCKQPYIVVNYNEVIKQLNFSCGTPVKNYKYVDITYKTGLWGYDVIVDKRLHN